MRELLMYVPVPFLMYGLFMAVLVKLAPRFSETGRKQIAWENAAFPSTMSRQNWIVVLMITAGVFMVNQVIWQINPKVTLLTTIFSVLWIVVTLPTVRAPAKQITGDLSERIAAIVIKIATPSSPVITVNDINDKFKMRQLLYIVLVPIAVGLSYHTDWKSALLVVAYTALQYESALTITRTYRERFNK